jgi:hypothetical protein
MKHLIILLCKCFPRHLYLFAYLSSIGIQAYETQVVDASLGATTRRAARIRLIE